MKNLKVKTIVPLERPSFNEWCEMFKVSTQYIDKAAIRNAERIMSLWDGCLGTKNNYIKFTNIKTNKT
jgi:hypothetical protein